MKKLLTILFLVIAYESFAQTAPDTPVFMSKRQVWRLGPRHLTSDTFMINLSGTSGFGLPAGTTAQRPSVPTGWYAIRKNTDSAANLLELGTSAGWNSIGGGSGGGSSTFAGLTDVNISSPADGQIAVYRTSDNKWHNETSSLTTAFVNGLNAFGANSTIGNSDNFALSIRTNNAARINITNAGAVSLPDGSLTVGGTTNGVINIQSSAASTRGSLDLGSNNPRNNSATGTWLFASTSSTVGTYNGTGWHFGDGTVPAGARVGIMAGTTSIAPLRFFSGPLVTTPVIGYHEFLTDKVYFTITTGTARKEYALWDAAGTSGRVVTTTTNGRLADLAPGSDGNVLTLASGLPTWSAPAGATTIYTGDGTLSGDRIVSGGGAASLALGSSGSKLTALTANSSGSINLTASAYVQLFGGVQVSKQTATDANFAAADNASYIELVAITAARNFTLPTQGSGKMYVIHNKNTTGNAWNVVGNLVDAAGSALTTVPNSTVYMVISDGTNFIKIN